jgi:hypothetical protein
MKTKKIKSVNIGMSFNFATRICIATLLNKKSTKTAIDIAGNELIRFADELDRLNKLNK